MLLKAVGRLSINRSIKRTPAPHRTVLLTQAGALRWLSTQPCLLVLFCERCSLSSSLTSVWTRCRQQPPSRTIVQPARSTSHACVFVRKGVGKG